MKKIFFILIITSLCILLLAQCKRKKGEYLGTISFTEQDLQIVPYLGGESFTLVDSLGDSIHYHIQNPRYLGTYETINPDHQLNTQADIEYEDYYIVEEAQIMDSQNLLDIWLEFSSPFKEPLFKFISIDIGANTHPEINNFHGAWKFEQGILYLYPGSTNTGIAFHDSLTFVNHKFYFVYDLSRIIDIGDTSNSISNIYYTIDQGIIGLKTTKGHKWCLN
jgi:hypothetical protein